MKTINLNKAELIEVIETAGRDKYEAIDFARIILSRLATLDCCENEEKLNIIELVGYLVRDLESMELKTVKWED